MALKFSDYEPMFKAEGIDISTTGSAQDNVGIDITPKGAGTLSFVMGTTLAVTTRGQIDFTQLGTAEAVMKFVAATGKEAITSAFLATTANTDFVEIDVGGTTRYLRTYD